MFKKIIVKNKSGALEITKEQAQTFLSEKDLSVGECRGQMKTFGPWQIPVSYTALAEEKNEDTVVIHGFRTISRPKQSGYELVGQVSIEGKKRRAFTSSQLFSVDGKLVSVATIYVCKE